MRKHKYGARKVVVDGHRFDSRREADRYLELRQACRMGIISDLELQPEFLLQKSFRHNGKVVRAIKYKADFRYHRDGVEWIEDVKGCKTQVYGIKKKLFLKKYPDVNFREV